MNGADKLINEINGIGGTIVALLSYFLGEHWVVFGAFLLLNIADWVTGWMKAHMNKIENSTAGWKGVIKKLGYWIMIMLAFGVSSLFVRLGEVIGINLHVTTLLGWFVLGNLIINEVRSILENFVEMGYKVPDILVSGLEVANKALGDAENKTMKMDGALKIDTNNPNVDKYLLELDIPLDEVEKKDHIVLQVKDVGKKSTDESE